MAETFLQPALTGYRQLTENEVALMNLIKSHGESLRILIDDVVREASPDPRWVNIAQTHLQQGLMALTRAVAKPTSF